MKKINFIFKKTIIFTIFLCLFTAGITGCQETTSPPEIPAEEAEAHSAPTGSNTSDAEAKAADSSNASDGLTVHYMDVGQGDATLITCGEESMLIDAGDNSKGTTVQAYLSSQNITELDYVVGTHPDADHIGGLDVVITKFDCGKIFLTDEEKDTQTYEDVISAMEYKGYKKTPPVPGETYELGSASFTLLAPLQENSDSNDNSIALLLTYGDTSFYFEGDAGEEEEAQILSSGAAVKADVYKIGHHGSKTSTTDDMLAAVNPACAVISAGEDNRYGHPHAEVLNKLRMNGIRTFRTDEQGTVVAKSDGKNIVFNMSPSDTWRAGEPGDLSDREPAAKGSGNSAGTEGTVSDTADTGTAENEEIIVHVTDTGKKYHTKNCSFLKDSDREISLTDAVALGYEPCKVCHPPQ